jgi:uncharacterized protein YehS (DUF1456 family)
MMNNDILRSVRYLLDLSDQKVAGIIKLANPDLKMEAQDVWALLQKEGEPDFVECSDSLLANFLDGLVLHKRGPNPKASARPVAQRMSNNLVLKKLRVALELKDADMHQAFADAGFAISKPELSAFFRQDDHRNFRLCGDQILRNFLKGLTMRMRGNGDGGEKRQ